MSQKEYSRRQRVAPQLQRELTELVPHEFSDPRVNLVTFTEVKVTPDLKSATVYVSRLGTDPAPAVEFLNGVAGRIRHELGKRISLRHMPTLAFVADVLPEQAAGMNKLIREVVDEDRKHAAERGDDEAQN